MATGEVEQGYRLKIGEEALWGVVVAVTVMAMQLLVEFDAAAIEEWRTWAVAGGSALVRAAAAAVLVALGRGAID